MQDPVILPADEADSYGGIVQHFPVYALGSEIVIVTGPAHPYHVRIPVIGSETKPVLEERHAGRISIRTGPAAKRPVVAGRRVAKPFADSSRDMSAVRVSCNPRRAFVGKWQPCQICRERPAGYGRIDADIRQLVERAAFRDIKVIAAGIRPQRFPCAVIVGVFNAEAAGPCTVRYDLPAIRPRHNRAAGTGCVP